MINQRVFLALKFVVTSVASAAEERPVIEIHPVVDCADDTQAILLPDRMQSKIPGGGSRCMARDIIVGGIDIIGAEHTKKSGADLLSITLSDAARQRHRQFALDHYNAVVTLVIDHRIVTAPQPLLGSTVQIMGFSASEVDMLVERYKDSTEKSN